MTSPNSADVNQIPAPEKGIVLTPVEELALSAFNLFKANQFDKSLEILNKITKLKEQDGGILTSKQVNQTSGSFDPKVQHNITLLQYLLSQRTEPRKFLDETSKIKKKIEDMLVDQEDNNNTSQNNSQNSSSSGNANIVREKIGFEEADTYFIGYNQAVINLQMRQYATALTILEALFQNIEPVDEYLAMKICFLLIDTYLSLKLKEKVVIVISYLEKVISSNNGFNSSGLLNISSSNNTSYQSLSDSLADRDTFPTAININLGSNDSSSSSQNNNTISSELNNSNSTHEERKGGYLTEFIKEKIETEEIKYRIHLNKARLYLLSKNVKAAKKEVKAAFSSVSSPNNYQSLYSMFLKAHLEYARANFPKSIKLLIGSATIGNQPDESKQEHIKILYFNNLGCIHFRLKKYNLALHYFTKALRYLDQIYSSESIDSKSQPKVINLVQFANNKKQEIMYNIGTVLLLSGSPDDAFYCFQQSTLLFYKLPVVWLRLAECCLASHLKKLADISKKQKNHLIQRVRNSEDSSLNRIVLPSVTSSIFKGIKLREDSSIANSFSFFDPNTDDNTLSSSSSNSNSNNNNNGSSQLTNNYGNGILSFEYALKCVKNSLFLLTKDKNSSDVTNANNNNNNNNVNSSSSRGKSNDVLEANAETTKLLNQNNESKLEYLNLKMRAQCIGSYLSLSMNNPVLALSFAKELLNTLSVFNLQILQSPQSNNVSESNANGTKEKQISSSTYLYTYLFCLANLYAAESLCILNKPNEAILHIHPLLQFILNPQSNPSPFGNDSFSANNNNNNNNNTVLQHVLSLIFGQNSSPRDSNGFILPTYPNAATESQNMKIALCINLAVVHILKDDMNQAQLCVNQALGVARTTSGLLLQIYMDLKKGNTEQVITLLKSGGANLSPPKLEQ